MADQLDEGRSEVAGEVAGQVTRLLKGFPVEHSRQDLRLVLSLRGDENFRALDLVAFLQGGLVAMTRPDRPWSRPQRSSLTPLGRGPHRTGGIADALGVKITTLGPVRANLIRKGRVYSPSHGDMAFTVPLFNEFMRRAMPEPDRHEAAAAVEFRDPLTRTKMLSILTWSTRCRRSVMSKGSSRKDKVREAAADYGTLEVAASDLKNDWHHWLDQVSRGRRTLVVTRYGTPIATLAPVDKEPGPPLFGRMAGWVREEGDLVLPCDDGWDAEG